jgi:hypothetical protein
MQHADLMTFLPSIALVDAETVYPDKSRPVLEA